MTHDMLFNYYMKHRTVYDPANRPDYRKRRTFLPVPVPENLVLEETSRAGVEGELIRHKDAPSRKVVLFIHGGSFTSCDKGSDRSVCFYIVSHSHMDVYNTNYALAPEHPFPQGLDDCYNVYLSIIEEYGAKNVIIMGESAGACLALGVCNRAKAKGKDLPVCIVLLSPPVQAERKLESHTTNYDTDCIVSNFLEESWAEYFQTTDPVVLSSPEASPINGDFTDFPPTVVFASDSEILIDDSRMLEQKMTKQGAYCALEIGHNLIHVYPIYVSLPEGKAAMDRALSFMSRAFHH